MSNELENKRSYSCTFIREVGNDYLTIVDSIFANCVVDIYRKVLEMLNSINGICPLCKDGQFKITSIEVD